METSDAPIPASERPLKVFLTEAGWRALARKLAGGSVYLSGQPGLFLHLDAAQPGDFRFPPSALQEARRRPDGFIARRGRLDCHLLADAFGPDAALVVDAERWTTYTKTYGPRLSM